MLNTGTVASQHTIKTCKQERDLLHLQGPWQTPERAPDDY